MPPSQYKVCVVCGLRSSRIANQKRKFMAKFPINEERCKQWVKVIGNEDLAFIPIEKLYQLKYVCEDHFHHKDFNRNKNRLKAWAIPSVRINAQPLSDDSLVQFPYHIYKDVNVSVDHTAMDIGSPGTTLHRFPNPEKDPERFRTWLYNIGGDILTLDNQYIFKYRNVCHKHFESRHITSGSRLTNIAIPCLQMQEMHGVLHGFPHPEKDRNRFNTWLYAIGGDILGLVTERIFKYRRVCHTHFEEKYLCRNNRISNIAVPTLNMPGILPTKFTNKKENQQPENEEACVERPADDKQPRGRVLKTVDVVKLADDQIQLVETSDFIEEEFYDGDILQSNEEQPVFSWQMDSAAVPCDVVTKEVTLRDLLMQCDESDELYVYPDSGASLSAGVRNKEDAVPVIADSKQEYKCNLCEGAINGFRYTCVQCVDFDLCASCEARGAHALHYMLRVPEARTHSEVFAVLQTLRRILVTDSVIQLDNATVDELKVEVKEEPVDPIYMEQVSPLVRGRRHGAAGGSLHGEDIETEVADQLEEDIETDVDTLEEDIETDVDTLEEDIETEVADPLEKDIETAVADPLEKDIETAIADPFEEDVEMLEEHLDTESCSLTQSPRSVSIEPSPSKTEHDYAPNYINLAPKPPGPLYLVVELDKQRQLDVRLTKEAPSRELENMLSSMPTNLVGGLSSTSRNKSITVGHSSKLNTAKTSTQTRYVKQTTQSRPLYQRTIPIATSLRTEALHKKLSPVQVYSYNVQNTDVSKPGTSRNLNLDKSIGPAKTLAISNDGGIKAVKHVYAREIPKKKHIGLEKASVMVPRVVLEDIYATRKT